MPRAIDACLGVVLVAALAGPARAGGEEWSVAFERGLADMLAGRYESGCPSLAESYRLAAKPGTLFTLAECEAKWGKSASALTHYEEYQTVFAGMTPDQRAQQKGRDKVAIEARAKLEREVPHLTLALPPGAPAGTVVRRDGVVLGPDAIGADARVDPGEHVITTEVPGGGPAREQRISIASGERKRVELEIAPPATTPAAPATPDEPTTAPGSRRTWVFVAAGVGLAGFAVGGVTGALALGKKGTVTDHCNVDAHRCDSEGKDAVDAGQTLGAISTVGFVVGAAGAAAAVILFLTEPKTGNHEGAQGARRSHGPRKITSSLRLTSVPAGAPWSPGLGVEGAW